MVSPASGPWNPLDMPVDYVVLAGQKSPGLASIEGLVSPRKWDERRGFALSGSTLFFRGIGLAKFKIILRLYNVEDWNAWDSWSVLVKRPPQTQRTVDGFTATVFARPHPMDIGHPLTEMLGIKSVVVENLHQPMQTGDGEWSINIDMIEHRRPIPAGALMNGSNEIDPVEQRIAVNTVRVAVASAVAEGARNGL